MRIKNRRRYAKQTYDMEHIIHHEIKQVSMKRNLNKWVKLAEDELSKEINKFHIIEAFLPLDSSHTKEEEIYSGTGTPTVTERKLGLFH